MIPVYKNHAPSLYGPTVPVEVRRNVATNPRMLSNVSLPLSNWPAANTLTKSAPLPVPHPQGIVTGAKSVSDGSSAELLSVYGVDNLTAAGSPERILGVWVLVTEPGYRIYPFNGWDAQELTANTWTYVTQVTPIPADSWSGFQVSRITGMASTTAACYITGCVAAPGTVPPAQFFDDQYSPDPDMTPELVPSGNGASRLIGQHPTAFTDVNCVSIIHEVGDGTRELRLIPTGASNNTGSWFSIPAGAPRTLATAIGAVRLPAALTGTLSPTARMIAAETPYAGVSAAAPNQPGTSDLVGSISGLTSSYRVHLRHGGTQGSGDVYWSNIGLYAGDYQGLWFDGGSGVVIIDGQPYDTFWAGTPGSSPSLAILSEGGFSGSIYDTLYVFSTVSNSWVRWQTPAVRGQRPVTLARSIDKPSAEAYTMRVSRRIFDEVRDLYTTPY